MALLHSQMWRHMINKRTCPKITDLPEPVETNPIWYCYFYKLMTIRIDVFVYQSGLWFAYAIKIMWQPGSENNGYV